MTDKYLLEYNDSNELLVFNNDKRIFSLCVGMDLVNLLIEIKERGISMIATAIERYFFASGIAEEYISVYVSGDEIVFNANGMCVYINAESFIDALSDIRVKCLAEAC